MTRFQGNVVLVTGGTSGIGRALAEGFLREGASVAVIGGSAAEVRAFRGSHPRALALAGDVTDPAVQMSMAGRVAERFGRLDILVHGAGTLVERDFANGAPDADELADEFARNVIAPVQLTAHALSRWPCLAALVFVTSGYALVSPRRAPTYGAAAAAMHGFAEGLRRQFGARGIHVLEVLAPIADDPAALGTPREETGFEEAVQATLEALVTRRPVAASGSARFLPALLRLAPGATGRRVGNDRPGVYACMRSPSAPQRPWTRGVPVHAIAEAVNLFIREVGDFVCDRCVKEGLRLRHLSQV